MNTGTGLLSGAALRRVVWTLCITEIVSWGVLFYAFPVLATTIAETEGWSMTTLVAIFTGSQVFAAVCGIWVGRHIDRRGPRVVMTLGSVVGVAAVVAVALAESLLAYAFAWAAVGAAMSATLYAPAFAAITHWAAPAHRVRALTAVTLVAGFASTVFAPLAAVLATRTDWRTAYLLLAVPLLGTVALHLFGLRAPWPPQPTVATTARRRRWAWRPSLDPVITQRAFAELLLGLTLGGFAIYAVVVNFVPLLNENGIDTTTAAIALGVGGAGQVAGRLLYAPLHRRMRVAHRTAATLALAAVTTAALALVPGPVVVVVAISFVAGGARGVFTLVQATAVSDRWGTTAYGSRNAVLSGSITAAAAISPWAGAALAATLGTYAGAFTVLAGLAAAAAVLTAQRGAAADFPHDGN